MGILLDCDYFIRNEKPVIRLWIKHEDGTVTVKEDDTFEPYFYAHSNDLDKLEDTILSMESKRGDNIIRVKRVERCRKKISGIESEVLRIVVYQPGHVPIFRDRLKAKNIDLFECDIVFTARFIIDHNLKPFQEIEVK